MTRLATCTLLGPQVGNLSSPLFTLTHSDVGMDPGDNPTNPPSWRLANDSRAAFEGAILDALRTRCEYPNDIGNTMLRSIGWQNGLAMLTALKPKPTALRLALTELTCRLLPEMAPVHDSSDARPIWLDTILPVYRTLSHVNRPMVVRLPQPSVAIVYQVEKTGIFEKLAGEVSGQLFDVDVDVYPGDDLAEESKRVAAMQEVFFKHSAVVILGHLRRPRRADVSGGGKTVVSGGWMITENDALEFGELRTFLGGWCTPSQGLRHPATVSRVPEVLLCGCCCGAWGEPETNGATDLFYPELFLSAGVRFFIGSWTDVIVRTDRNSGGNCDDLNLLARLFSSFLKKWAESPDHAVTHLYQAKKEIGFPLLASLFQLYTTVDPLPAEVPLVATASEVKHSNVPSVSSMQCPAGALVDRLAPENVLGKYSLKVELWRDPYAVSFWAESSEGSHILQFLVDAWQDEASIALELEKKLVHLQSQGFGPGQLIPDRTEQLPLPDVGDGALQLVALIYDRPSGENSSEWSMLRSNPLDRSRNNHYQHVLQLGGQVACCLWELHSKEVLHGNFDSGCILLHRRAAGDDVEETVYLKDAWVQAVKPGRCTDIRYASPEETAGDEGEAQFKRDCWGLGVVLYELSTGRSPDKNTSIRRAAGEDASRVPEALDRVVRECLVPSAAVRPSAEVVARRLLLAIQFGGTYIEDLAAEFELRIRAGHRLFAVRVEDCREIEHILFGLQKNPREDLRYHLYIAAEGQGIIDSRTNRTVQGTEWKDGSQIQGQQYIAPTHRLTPPEVSAWNGLNILKWAANLDAPPRGELPVLLIKGMDWWEGISVPQALLTWRVLKHTQREWGYPIIVVADSVIRPLGDVTQTFLLLDFPPPPPSELFERLLGASQILKGAPPLEEREAAWIASRLYPCKSRELEEIMRLSELQYGTIDRRIVAIRDHERARRFGGAGVMSYVPSELLPPLNHVGWPPALESTVSRWLQVRKNGDIGPHRVLITGEQGYGKSFAAQALAGNLQLPLIRLEASRCLTQDLGGSEKWLHESLSQIMGLGGVVVLIDGIDGFTSPEGQAETTVNATLARMSAILRNWICTVPPNVIVLLTAIDGNALSASWQRLVDLRLEMNEPLLFGVDEPSLAYRRSVFRALFRKHHLNDLAEDHELMHRIARDTHPMLREEPLAAPVARLRPGSGLGQQVVELRDGSQIEDWMATTILYHTPLANLDYPTRRTFWEAAIE